MVATTGFLEESFDLDGNYNTAIWDVKNLECGSMQFIWSGADALNTATISPQASNDGENWNDVSVGLGPIELAVAAENQVWEFERFTTRYVRLSYVANGNSGGIGRIVSWAHMLQSR